MVTRWPMYGRLDWPFIGWKKGCVIDTWYLVGKITAVPRTTAPEFLVFLQLSACLSQRSCSHYSLLTITTILDTSRSVAIDSVLQSVRQYCCACCCSHSSKLMPSSKQAWLISSLLSRWCVTWYIIWYFYDMIRYGMVLYNMIMICTKYDIVPAWRYCMLLSIRYMVI